MRTRHIIFALALLLTVSGSPAAAGGRLVTVWFLDGTVVRGELIAVGESTLVVSDEEGISDEALLSRAKYLSVCAKADLGTVIIEGNSHVLMGMGLGALCGITAGMLIGASSDASGIDAVDAVARPVSTGLWATVGGLGGLAIGGIVGAAASTSGEEADVRALKNLLLFRPHARFTGEIPPALRSVGR